jgi:hypothetical protein
MSAWPVIGETLVVEGACVSDIQEQFRQEQEAGSESKPGAGSIVLGVICLIVALAAFGLGSLERSRANNFDPNTIYCGDDLMSPGDSCIDFSGDGGGDYREMREQHLANHETSKNIARVSMLVAPVAGGLALLLFVVGIAKRASARRRARSGGSS